MHKLRLTARQLVRTTKLGRDRSKAETQVLPSKPALGTWLAAGAKGAQAAPCVQRHPCVRPAQENSPLRAQSHSQAITI